MSETIKDIIDVISCCCGCQGDRTVFIVEKPVRKRYPDFPGAILYLDREAVSLAQLRDRLISAYRYEHDEPAKKLLKLLVDAFRQERYATLFDLVAQAEDFLKRTSKTSNPTPESEAAK